MWDECTKYVVVLGSHWEGGHLMGDGKVGGRWLALIFVKIRMASWFVRNRYTFSAGSWMYIWVGSAALLVRAFTSTFCTTPYWILLAKYKVMTIPICALRIQMYKRLYIPVPQHDPSSTDIDYEYTGDGRTRCQVSSWQLRLPWLDNNSSLPYSTVVVSIQIP
jgi:hypothetical protein